MLFGKIGDVAQAAVNVATDPCLATVAGQLNTLHELQTVGQPDIPSGPMQASIGIGLCKAVGPLNALIFFRRNPILGILLAGGIGYGIFAAGMKYGRRKPA